MQSGGETLCAFSYLKGRVLGVASIPGLTLFYLHERKDCAIICVYIYTHRSIYVLPQHSLSSHRCFCLNKLFQNHITSSGEGWFCERLQDWAEFLGLLPGVTAQRSLRPFLFFLLWNGNNSLFSLRWASFNLTLSGLLDSWWKLGGCCWGDSCQWGRLINDASQRIEVAPDACSCLIAAFLINDWCLFLDSMSDVSL